MILIYGPVPSYDCGGWVHPAFKSAERPAKIFRMPPLRDSWKRELIMHQCAQNLEFTDRCICQLSFPCACSMMSAPFAIKFARP